MLVKQIEGSAIDHAHEIEYQKAALHTFESLYAASDAIVAHCISRGVAACWPGRQKTPYQKDIAVAAGLGSKCISGLFISGQLGIDVHLETVLIAYPLKTPWPTRTAVFSWDSCGLCVSACPAGVLDGKTVLSERCSIYRKSHVEPYEGHTYCGLCMKACPQRKKIA